MLKSQILIAAALSGAVLFSNGPAAAMPLSAAIGGTMLTSQAADASSLIDVRYRRGRSGGIAAGVIAGTVIGGIIASQAYPYPSYYQPYSAYRVYPSYSYDDAIAYCIRQYRSYDPYSRTYLGYDGFRHSCP